MARNDTPRLLKLDRAGLQDALSRDLLIVVFFAEWCSPCREFRETLAASADANPDLTYSLVDIERQPKLAAMFGVESVPKIVVLRAGAIVFSHAGALVGEVLEDVIGQVRALDVDALRRRAATSAE
ncbi:thioredoxin family protein [Krasilnikovia sp. MM14-A1004]|uniref:thioredoxin family protein n=1 Tax=Krasilnikovia sp. MM14-A1004 TaxID=3373541 RepID=UPI00399D04A9